jgi:hypothetical protein
MGARLESCGWHRKRLSTPAKGPAVGAGDGAAPAIRPTESTMREVSL